MYKLEERTSHTSRRISYLSCDPRNDGHFRAHRNFLRQQRAFSRHNIDNRRNHEMHSELNNFIICELLKKKDYITE